MGEIMKTLGVMFSVVALVIVVGCVVEEASTDKQQWLIIGGQPFAVEDVRKGGSCVEGKRLDLDVEFRWCGDYLLTDGPEIE